MLPNSAVQQWLGLSMQFVAMDHSKSNANQRRHTRAAVFARGKGFSQLATVSRGTVARVALTQLPFVHS
jgi:hypothetical protein